MPVKQRASPASWKGRFGGIDEKLPIRANRALMQPVAIKPPQLGVFHVRFWHRGTLVGSRQAQF
jgi:hypothetical protein